MEVPKLNLERGHVCPYCFGEIPTGFYYVTRVVQDQVELVIPGLFQGQLPNVFPCRVHPSCAQLREQSA